MGLYRLHTLCILYPSLATRLNLFRKCVEEVGCFLLPFKSNAELEGEGEADGEGDGEVDDKTLVWKFRVLDLVIEMLFQDLTEGEVLDILVYAERVFSAFIGMLSGLNEN